MGPARIRNQLRDGYDWVRQISGSWADLGSSGLANLLFPPVCSFCGADLATLRLGDLLLCGECRRMFSDNDRHACSRCASPLPAHARCDTPCPRCYNRDYCFERTVALGEYRGAFRQAVLNMKRPQYEPLMRALGFLLGELVENQLGSACADLIVPVPAHWWRRFRRGTNTARLLARFAGQALQLPVRNHLLSCRRKTRKQGTLLPHERLQNVRHAFRVSAGYDITDAQILLVDDIMTTGATANESARILRRAGARSVVVAVVARGVGQV